MKILDRIAAILILLIGAVHSAFSLPLGTQYNDTRMWVLSGGFMMIFLGLLNLVRSTTPGDIPRAAALTANYLGLLFALWLVPLFLPLRQNPQVAVLLALVVVATIMSVMRRDTPVA